ncbi:MAG TPA: chemotaxis protein CheA [Myxococcaceae bacterium]|nr:chemotaxis protein CheA [Myxococcaceae bacterium]
MTTSTKGLSDFVAEATEILDALSRDLAILDRRRGERLEPDLVNGIFRSAHSLKGLAAMFGEQRIAQLAHQTEDLLDRLRLGRIELTEKVVDALIESFDTFQVVLAETSRRERSAVATERAEAVSQKLAQFIDSGTVEQSDALDQLELDTQVRNVLTEYEEHRLRENLREGMAVWKVRAVFDLSDFDQGLARLNSKLKSLGEVISTLPSADPGDGTGIAFDIIFGGKVETEKLRLALTALPASVHPLFQFQPQPAEPSLPLERLVSPTPPGAEPEHRSPVRVAVSNAPQQASGALPAYANPRFGTADAMVRPSPKQPDGEGDPVGRGLTQTVRVDIGRLDSLMDAVGELLLIKANVARLAEQASRGGKPPPGQLWGHELHRESRLLERKLDDLQKGILEVRMVPLGQVFDKLARTVRRIARESGKEVDFLMRGGEVEVDKLIVEALSDPLMHIVRNAVDHGVETPDERERLSKRPRAAVAIRAMQRGNQVVIEISDDGRGLDEERIREVAVRTGILTRAQAEEMTPRELQRLIFLPGFSTASRVSELSGRGVGLDVVKTNISRLSGMIDTHSERGVGSTFTITLPETLAIVRALVVSVSGRVYAVPLNAVSEITSIAESEVRTVEGREVIGLRGKTIPLARLARVFELPETELRRRFILVVGLAHRRLGIAVDELLGQQDVVVKPLGGRLRHTPGIAGATDLGDRNPVLVLDTGALIEEVVNSERRPELV